MSNHARRLLAAVASAIMAGGLLAAGGSPPAAAAATATVSVRPTAWASIDRHQPRAAAIDGAGDAGLGTWRDDGGARHTTRAYFTYDLGSLSGAGIRGAKLSVRQTAAKTCRFRPALELWRTGDVTARTSWRRPPADVRRLDPGTTIAGDPCPTALHDFDVADAVRGALADGLRTLTLSVRLPASAEKDARRHVRIANSPELTVDADAPGSPTIDGAASGIDVPHRITLRPGTPGVVRWTWKLMSTEDDEPEVHVVPAAADGTAVITVTLTRPGLYLFSAISHTADGRTGEASTYFEATSEPRVHSDVYLPGGGEAGGVGVADTFTFHPNSPDVVSYRYAFNAEPERSVTTVDGVGTVSWAPPRAGSNVLQVNAVDSAGKESQRGRYFFDVAGATPRVDSQDYPGYGIGGGVQVPGRFDFAPGVSDVTAYLYRLDDGPEQTVDADENGRAAVDLTPARIGRHDLAVRSRTRSGEVSEPTVFTFVVANRPSVSGTPYGFDGSGNGRPGLAGQFVLSMDAAGLPGVVRYFWSVGDEQFTAEAGADGTATVSYVPRRPGEHRMTVVAQAADGRRSDPFEARFTVADPAPTVYSDIYTEWNEAGGVGQPGQFWLTAGVSGATEFGYRLNGGAEQVVPAENDSATVTLTPDRTGENVLAVEARWPDGRTATTTWTFLVAG
ncbi:hypothetical protein [Actinoplanes sp. NPDC049118]|uniref:hypothetical protein n=1 Tax=Actinoplanes sp. NPDC049118 TaxID=3155769 RepID=UPI0033F1134F